MPLANQSSQIGNKLRAFSRWLLHAKRLLAQSQDDCFSRVDDLDKGAAPRVGNVFKASIKRSETVGSAGHGIEQESTRLRW